MRFAALSFSSAFCFSKVCLKWHSKALHEVKSCSHGGLPHAVIGEVTASRMTIWAEGNSNALMAVAHR